VPAGLDIGTRAGDELVDDSRLELTAEPELTAGLELTAELELTSEPELTAEPELVAGALDGVGSPALSCTEQPDTSTSASSASAARADFERRMRLGICPPR